LDNKEYSSAGGVLKFLNGKYFVSQELSEENIDNILSKVAGIGTVNSGNNFIASGIAGNINGILIGSASTTVEIQNIAESLDYI
jgi:translation initiation factor 6 (eIF-6)